MNETIDWRARAVAAEAGCFRGVTALQKLLSALATGEGVPVATTEALDVLAAMRAVVVARGELGRPGGRRVHRSDAVLLARMAAGIFALGHQEEGRALAAVARRLAKYTGSPEALRLLEEVPRAAAAAEGG